MELFTKRYDPDDVDWHHVEVEPDETGFRVNYDYSILGYDLKSGRLDMLMRFAGDGAHCERHSHVASTTTLILEGEQVLEEQQPDGGAETILRKAGDYALAGPDALPHTERGGPEGCVLLLSLHARDGVLFKAFAPDFQTSLDVRIEDFVARWESR